jgi:hypothetical protein
VSARPVASNLLLFEIPETGAEAAWRALGPMLGSGTPPATLHLGHSAELLKHDDAELAQYACVIGPFGVAHQGRFPPHWFTFTSLRDPVERVIDLYHRWRSGEHGAMLAELANSQDIYSFAASNHPAVVEFIDNTQVLTLVNDPAMTARSAVALPREILLRTAAQSLLQLDGFGLYEEWRSMIVSLAEAFALDHRGHNIENLPAPERPDPTGATDIDRARLRCALGDRIGLDEALVRFARKAARRDLPRANTPWRQRMDRMRTLLEQCEALLNLAEERLRDRSPLSGQYPEQSRVRRDGPTTNCAPSIPPVGSGEGTTARLVLHAPQSGLPFSTATGSSPVPFEPAEPPSGAPPPTDLDAQADGIVAQRLLSYDLQCTTRERDRLRTERDALSRHVAMLESLLGMAGIDRAAPPRSGPVPTQQSESRVRDSGASG